MNLLKIIFFILFLFDFTFEYRFLIFEPKGNNTGISGHQPFKQEHVSCSQECFQKCVQIPRCVLVQYERLSSGSGWLCELFKFISNLPSYLVTRIGRELYSISEQGDCLAWKDEGYQKNGVYRLTNGREVFCDMIKNGGGWTVLQRRIDGSVDFSRGWDEYKNGFGEVEGEYWIGNEAIHFLTKDQTQNMMVKVEATTFDGETNYIIMDGFWIEDESNGYKLHLGQHLEGNAAHSVDMFYSNGMKFSTFDRDNDVFNKNCALKFLSGYWHNKCRLISPNAPYLQPSKCVYKKGIHWARWKTYYVCLKEISISIKTKA